MYSIASKIKHRLDHVIWKISWNILPVRPNIFKFTPVAGQKDTCCPMCNGSQETIQHILLSRPFARIIWRNIRWPLDTSTYGSLPITVWIKAFLRPHAELAIPKVDAHNFQVTAAVAMDHLFGLEQKPFMKIALMEDSLVYLLFKGTYSLCEVVGSHVTCVLTNSSVL
jgi:hypothetical protein